jgi:hypothetical protein
METGSCTCIVRTVCIFNMNTSLRRKFTLYFSINSHCDRNKTEKILNLKPLTETTGTFSDIYCILGNVDFTHAASYCQWKDDLVKIMLSISPLLYTLGYASAEQYDVFINCYQKEPVSGRI